MIISNHFLYLLFSKIYLLYLKKKLPTSIALDNVVQKIKREE